MGEAAARSARDTRLDVARGLAIAGVVIDHVYRGLFAADVVEYSTTAGVDRMFSFWALSVFVFVTGTFVPQGVRKIGASAYLRDRVARFFVVYLVWTVIQGGVQLLAASLVNTPTSVGAIFAIWRPLGQLWYLPFLILILLVLVPLKPWAPRSAPWVLGATAVVSVVFWGYDGGYVGTQGLGLLVFFAAGLAIGSARVKAALDRFSPVVALALGLGVLVGGAWIAIATSATSPTIFWDGRTVVTVSVGIVIAVATSMAVFLVGHGLRSVAFIALVGRRSLEVYLAHVTLAAGTRIVLMHFGVTSVWILATLGILAGVFGSLVVGSGLRRIGLGWVFDGPGWLSRTSTAGRGHAPPDPKGG